MGEAVTWYLALAVIGAAGLLPAALLFERLPSLGVLYARPAGLAVVALGAWLIGWSEVLAYGTAAVLLALAALITWSASIAWRRRDLLAALLERRRLLLAGEAVVVVAFALLALARMQAPDAVNTEKPMDLMLLVAVRRAETMPPPDPWLAGERLSYYHLGQTALDATARLSGNPPGVAFNLGVAAAGGMAAAAVLGLALDAAGLGGRRPGGGLRRHSAVVGGAVALTTLLLVAPLTGLVNILAANGIGGERAWGWLGVERVPAAEGATLGVPDEFLWWWAATRTLPDTITEFPAFALLLGDPHAHLLALPLVLVTVALALVAFEGSTPLTWRRWLRAPDALALAGALFAALVMTNAWDLVTLGPLWGLAGVAAVARTGWPPFLAISVALRWAAPPVALAFVLAWPFLGSLDAPPLGLAPVTGEHSDPLRWLLVWLPPLLPAAVALALAWPGASWRALAGALGAVGLAVALWLLAAAGIGEGGELVERGAGWITLALIGGLLAACAAGAATADGRRERGLAASIALLGVVAAIWLALELVHIDDAFAGRFNTVFKYGFQAWALQAAAAGALAALAAEQRWGAGRPDGASDARGDRGPSSPTAALPGERRRGTAKGTGVLALASGVAIVLLLTSLYTPAMAVSRAREGQTPGLDATAYLERRAPGIAAAAAWSRVHLDPREHVVVQAVGESYTEGNLLSTHSGVPTLLAWPNHQRQWRGAIAERERRAAVEAIYAGPAEERERAIERWRVTHVLVGPQERTAYGSDVLEAFAGWPVAFEAAGVTILEVPR